MKRLIFSILIICFISYKLWQDWDGEKIIPVEAENAYVPDYKIEALKRVDFDSNGQIKTRLTANLLEHHQKLKYTFIKQPSYTLYNNQQADWLINAQEGSIHDNNYLELEGNVEIKSASENNWLNQISMLRINMDLNTQELSSDTQITGIGKTIEFTGNSLKANLKIQEFELTNYVQTKYLVD